MPPGFARVGADQVTVTDAVDFTGRVFGRVDGSTFSAIATRSETPLGAVAACTALLQYLETQGFKVLSSSQRGEGGVVLVGILFS